MVDGLEASFTACRVKGTNIAIGQKICVNCRSLFTGWKCLVFAKLVGRNLTFRAPATVCTGHKGLLGVVPNKVSKYWMALPPDTVTAHHGNSSFTIVADRIQYIAHTPM